MKIYGVYKFFRQYVLPDTPVKGDYPSFFLNKEKAQQLAESLNEKEMEKEGGVHEFRVQRIHVWE